MYQNTLSNELVELRAPEPGDVDMLFMLENDPDCSQYSFATAPMSRQALWDYVNNYNGDFHAMRQLRLIIVERAGGNAVGAIDLTDYDPANSRAFVGVGLLPAWRGKGLASAALQIVLDYAPARLGLHQLAAVVADDNRESLALFRRAGFKACGKLRSWHRRGRSFVDAILLQHLFA